MIFRLQVCMLQRRLMQSRGTAGCSSCPFAARRTQIAPLRSAMLRLGGEVVRALRAPRRSCRQEYE